MSSRASRLQESIRIPRKQELRTQCAGADAARTVEIVEAGKERDVLGIEGCGPGSKARRSAGADWPKRRGEDNAAEDPEPDYSTDEGLGGDLWASGQPAG